MIYPTIYIYDSIYIYSEGGVYIYIYIYTIYIYIYGDIYIYCNQLPTCINTGVIFREGGVIIYKNTIIYVTI